MATRPDELGDDDDLPPIREMRPEEFKAWVARGGRTPEERARSRRFLDELEQKYGPWDPEVIERYEALLKEALQAIDDA